MSDRTIYDDFRDLAEGRLDAADAARVRALVESDAAVRAEFEAFGAVHAFTAPAAVPVPPTSLTIERIEAARRAERGRRIRPWLALAASLLVAAAGVFTWHHHAPRTVRLRAIPLSHAALALDDAALVPARLADWRPVRDGAVAWIPTLEEGREVARATNRPVFLWIYHPDCPFCVEWDRDAFRDPEVGARAAEFVPVRLDVMKTPGLEKYLGEDVMANWPYLGVMSADEKQRVDFPGMQSTTAIRDHLAEAAVVQERLGAAVPWDAAAAMARADRARSSGDVAEEYRELAAVRDAALPPAAKEGAARRIEAIAARAAVALRQAQSLAATDEEAGARSLAEAAERFRGTPYGLDLAVVEQALRATGRFPVVEETTQ